MNPVPDLCLSRLAADYESGARTPLDVVREIIALRRAHSENPIWIHKVSDDALLTRARDLESMSRDRLPLFGIPFAVKDNIDVAGLPTSAACEAFTYTPEDSSTAVELLLEAGAILIGKTNLDQFATGLVGTRSPYGACRNAFDEAYVSGGSSSGSAVAVALGMASFSLGTDTAGSGRVPAGFNNIVGLKPSVGRVSTRGVVPACRSLDCVSVFALTAEDATQVLSVIGKPDHDHPGSRTFEGKAGLLPSDFTFAVPDPSQLRFFGNDNYALAFAKACTRMTSLGGREMAFDYQPFSETAALLYEGPWVAERYHAARPLIDRDPDALLPVIRTILDGAKNFDAVDTFDAFYRLEDLRHRCADLWKCADVMVLPTAPTHPTIAAVADEPIVRNSELGAYTNFVNFLDLCAVAVPSAMIAETGLPFGITLIGPAGRDTALLELAGKFHADTKLPLGATRHKQPPRHATVPSSPVKDPEWISIAVCGAHLSGQPLNHQLTGRGGRLVREAYTAPEYRMYALSGGPPARPGLVRTAGGARIRVEVWELPSDRMGGFVGGIPSPLGVGRLLLDDGTDVLGFICEGTAVADATDITKFGDWRAYLSKTAA